MPDGIITADLWTQIESHLSIIDKTKGKRTNDDQRNAIQELLSTSPSHSISFVLITSMLERMIQEISGNKRLGVEEMAGTAGPLSPTKKAFGGLKRIATWKSQAKLSPSGSGGKHARAAAEVFAPVVIRLPEGNEKGRGVQEKRRVDVMEIFLTRDEPG